MSYNGSGTFQINTSGQPVVTGTSISSTVFNALTADLATGLSTAITKDGQTTTTARIPFALGINSTLVTDATNITSGSIITAGGVGIAKALYVGTTANVAGAVTLGGVATFSAQPIFSSLTASSAVATDASKGLVSVTNTGTGNNVLATTPTIATPSISSPTISDGTANGVAYLNSSKVLTTGSALVFDGTNLVVGATSTLTSSSTTKVHVDGSIVAGNSDSGYSATSGIQQLMHKPAAEGNVTNAFGNNGSTGFQIVFASVAAYGAGGAATGIALGKNSSTNRSINAGGTINASGADYAEYMTKSGDFVLAKGDVVGIDANGKLTNVYADAVSFVVKSTDPSYVGGDTWGVVEQTADNKKPALTPEELEAARQLVDRIAFAGQVPVNVLGATAGQYIVPADDNGAIKGLAVSNPTFEQYQQAVGKVIAVEQDGRARIIVKVA